MYFVFVPLFLFVSPYSSLVFFGLIELLLLVLFFFSFYLFQCTCAQQSQLLCLLSGLTLLFQYAHLTNYALVTLLPALRPTRLACNCMQTPAALRSALASHRRAVSSSRQQLPLALPKFRGLLPTWLRPLVVPQRADSSRSCQPCTSVRSLLSSEPSFAFAAMWCLDLSSGGSVEDSNPS